MCTFGELHSPTHQHARLIVLQHQHSLHSARVAAIQRHCDADDGRECSDLLLYLRAEVGTRVEGE